MTDSPAKKVIISSNIIWTITQFRLGLIKCLVKMGFEVVCVADMDSFSALSLGILQESKARFVQLPVSRRGINPLNDIKYFVRYRKIIKEEKPDLIINYTVKPIIFGSIAAMTCNVPSFAVTTGLGFVFTKSSILTVFTKLLYRFSLLFPLKVFFLNRDDLKAFVDSGIVKKGKSLLLPGEGVDTEKYKPIKFESPLTVNKPFTFLLIARLTVEKGIYEYVKAARKTIETTGQIGSIPVRFQLAGYLGENCAGGIKKSEVDNWVNEGVITYLGALEDVRPAIMASDCIVLPSYREGVPRTLMEGASMGKPLIASNCPGCRDVVDDGINGFLCEPGSDEDLYEKMIKILHLKKEEQILMGLKGREKMIKSFDERIVIDVYRRELKGSGVLKV